VFDEKSFSKITHRLFFGKSRAQDFEEKEKIRNFQNATPPPS
jgi:hypothetical protein